MNSVLQCFEGQQCSWHLDPQRLSGQGSSCFARNTDGQPYECDLDSGQGCAVDDQEDGISPKEMSLGHSPTSLIGETPFGQKQNSKSDTTVYGHDPCQIFGSRESIAEAGQQPDPERWIESKTHDSFKAGGERRNPGVEKRCFQHF